MFNSIKYNKINDLLIKSSKNTKIVAISKNHPKSSVIEAINSGVKIFGENRVMEAKVKFEDLKKERPDIKLHLTGPLQSNKVKEAVSLFDTFHTLDREKIAREFSKHKDKLANKEIFIQVNTGEELTKSGVKPNELKDFIYFCRNEMELSITGLMCIPPIQEPAEKHFELLQSIGIKNNALQLSIGMSNDYETALKFKPTYIRLGTILFGKRI